MIPELVRRIRDNIKTLIIEHRSGYNPEPMDERTVTLELGYDIRTIQELRGHKDIKTRMKGSGVVSPLDTGPVIKQRVAVES